ncbi:unnamed protein product [Pedinophyceae sp. YPF-701]|nr:unnamed protein product [Pedinophyceae sp. YPF-701]
MTSRPREATVHQRGTFAFLAGTGHKRSVHAAPSTCALHPARGPGRCSPRRRGCAQRTAFPHRASASFALEPTARPLAAAPRAPPHACRAAPRRAARSNFISDLNLARSNVDAIRSTPLQTISRPNPT